MSAQILVSVRHVTLLDPQAKAWIVTGYTINGRKAELSQHIKNQVGLVPKDNPAQVKVLLEKLLGQPVVVRFEPSTVE